MITHRSGSARRNASDWIQPKGQWTGGREDPAIRQSTERERRRRRRRKAAYLPAAGGSWWSGAEQSSQGRRWWWRLGWLSFVVRLRSGVGPTHTHHAAGPHAPHQKSLSPFFFYSSSPFLPTLHQNNILVVHGKYLFPE